MLFALPISAKHCRYGTTDLTTATVRCGDNIRFPLAGTAMTLALLLKSKRKSKLGYLSQALKAGAELNVRLETNSAYLVCSAFRHWSASISSPTA